MPRSIHRARPVGRAAEVTMNNEVSIQEPSHQAWTGTSTFKDLGATGLQLSPCFHLCQVEAPGPQWLLTLVCLAGKPADRLTLTCQVTGCRWSKPPPCRAVSNEGRGFIERTPGRRLPDCSSRHTPLLPALSWDHAKRPLKFFKNCM